MNLSLFIIIKQFFSACSLPSVSTTWPWWVMVCLLFPWLSVWSSSPTSSESSESFPLSGLTELFLQSSYMDLLTFSFLFVSCRDSVCIRWLRNGISYLYCGQHMATILTLYIIISPCMVSVPINMIFVCFNPHVLYNWPILSWVSVILMKYFDLIPHASICLYVIRKLFISHAESRWKWYRSYFIFNDCIITLQKHSSISI